MSILYIIQRVACLFQSARKLGSHELLSTSSLPAPRRKMVYETICYKCSKMTYISLPLLDFVIGAVIAFVGLWLFLDWELKLYVWLPFVIVGGLLILAAVLGSACTIICPTYRIPCGLPSTLSLPGRRPAQIRWALKAFFCLLVASSSRRPALCCVSTV